MALKRVTEEGVSERNHAISKMRARRAAIVNAKSLRGISGWESLKTLIQGRIKYEQEKIDSCLDSSYEQANDVEARKARAVKLSLEHIINSVEDTDSVLANVDAKIKEVEDELKFVKAGDVL